MTSAFDTIGSMTTHTVYIARVVFPDTCQCGSDSLLKVGYTRREPSVRLEEFCRTHGAKSFEILETRQCNCALLFQGRTRSGIRIHH